MRNLTWSKPELTLALDLYLRHRSSLLGPKSTEVQELSQLLAEMGRQSGRPMGAKYRNANGVSMKLINFRRWDPAHTTAGKIGLPKGNRLEEEVWREFSNDKVALQIAVAAIRREIGY